MDMTTTITPKSDQINYDDFLSGPKTITITEIKGNGAANDPQPVSVYYQGDNGKPYKPCKSMRRVMVAAWGANAIEYVGRSLTLFGDPNVIFGGAKVGGIRISHMSHIKNELNIALTASKAKRIAYRVLPMNIDISEKSELNEADEETIKQTARDIATLGNDKLTEHFKAQSKPDQVILATIRDELRGIADRADNPPPGDE